MMTEKQDTNLLKNESGNKEHGAIIVEATVSLSIFMFAIYTILSIITICYTQERVAISLNSATKQVAQCGHLLKATGANKVISGDDGSSTAIANKISEFLESLGSIVEGLAPDDIVGLINGAAGSIKNDSVMDVIRTWATDGVVERLMDKNLRTDGCSGLEDFKRKHRIKNMNFIGSNVMEKGDNIYMMVNYDVEVVKLLHIEKVFHFSHGAYAEIW